MADPNVQKIIDFLDRLLIDTGRKYISPVEANSLLAKADMLSDSQHRPGKPLRDLLRRGQLPHAYQSNGKGSEWLIPLSPKALTSTDIRILPSNNRDGEVTQTLSNDGTIPSDRLLYFEELNELRRELIRAYCGRCAVTGYNVSVSLEATQIVPSLGSLTYHITNWLLFRADIRVLFDLHKLTIDPTNHEVLLSPRLENTFYSDLKGVLISLPKQSQMQPSQRSLQYHFELFMKSST